MKLFLTILILSAIVSNSSAQTVTTIVSNSNFNDGLALDTAGNIYASRYFGSNVSKISPQGEVSIFATGFISPNGIAFGDSSYLFVPSGQGQTIHKVAPDGTTILVNSTINSPSGIAFNSEGIMYVAIYPNDRIDRILLDGTIEEFYSGNGLNGPVGLAFDENDNLYLNNFDNGQVVKITPDSILTVLGDMVGNCGFMTLAPNAIYATAISINKIYKITYDGVMTEFAGTGAAGQNDGHVSQATFNGPNGIIATSTGDTLYISDFNTNSLRMITGVNNPTSVEDDVLIVTEFALEQNFPNPFNPATTITYSIPKAVSGLKTKIIVYDILGNEIATLVNEEKTAGIHQVTFDASALTSGIYFYQLTAGDFINIKKMTLLK